MKKLLPSYILSIIICFTIFLYEPITMYANNINDFWFDFWIMLKPILVLFLSSTIIALVLYTLIYKLNNKFIKKSNIYNIILVLSYIVFFASYIQGNFLVGNLPSLDGTKIVWEGYRVDNIITLVIWLVIITIYIITIKKYKFEKVINTSKYISLAVLAMLSVSLITIIATTDVFMKKTILVSTTENINTASSDKNFFIFLVDAVDSRMFDNIRKKSEYKDTFNDFTYYPDTMSLYAFTRDSIPLILSGVWNDNKKNFIDYYDDAMNSSPLIDSLIEKQYDINIYDYELRWSTNKVKNVSNVKNKNDTLEVFRYAVHQLKYVGFKYLPYNLKKLAKIENLNFELCRKERMDDAFKWDNKIEYDIIKNNDIFKINDKMFKFIHVEGGHVPFDLDENLNKIENGTYEQKLKATLKLIDAYMKRLKENYVYDNSVIIVMADHGYNFENTDGRQNPILYIKGINEKHDMYESNKAISYLDLIDAYKDLLDNKKSEDLFENISSTRKRKYIWYEYTKENHMVEYEQSGKAWETEKLVPTGIEYNR